RLYGDLQYRRRRRHRLYRAAIARRAGAAVENTQSATGVAAERNSQPVSDADPPATLSLAHITRPPRIEAIGKPPLLLLLHGVGSNERDLFSFAGLLDPRFRVVSLRAPLVRGPESFAWFDVRFLPEGFAINAEHLRASRDHIARVIGEAVAAYDTDAERV